MISYTKRYVNIVSLIITIILYLLLIWTNLTIKNANLSPFSISKIFKRTSIVVELDSSSINQETKE